MMQKLYAIAENTIQRNPFTHVYGIARSLLALSTLLTFLLNDTSILFRIGAGIEEVPICSNILGYGIFCILNPQLEIARLLVILAMLWVISGYFPQISGLIHAYIAFSFNSCTIVLDGGDQVNAVLTLLLIPICLSDPRANHWTSAQSIEAELSPLTKIRRAIAWTTIWIIQVQVAIIYFHAAIAKFAVEEWTNGTALYYWLNDPLIGASETSKICLMPLVNAPILVVLLTWGTLLWEVFVFTLIFRPQEKRHNWLIFAIIFHFGTVVFFGIFSFFIAMSGALVLYMRRLDAPFFQKNKS